MTFFSVEFLLIFLAFFAIYWAFSKHYKAQNTLILIFNYALIFSFSPYFMLVIFLHTFFVSYFGLFIAYKGSKNAIFSGVFFSILYLCFFKYYDVIHADFRAVLLFFKFDFIANNLDIALPIGISFYTFSSVTYLVSIYKKEQAPSDFLSLACYLSFFATLIAGPIAKSTFMLPQFNTKREFKNGDLIVVLLLFGVVKKVLIANYLSGFVTEIFNDPKSFNPLEILTAIYCYGVWLYCDFSGYVDIVSALALSIGFALPLNFNMPYVALNLRDFWRRWHISLSNFIRDYIYIPLGGNKVTFFHTQVNILIAFSLSGIWHGVGLNFVIWGLLHGFGIVFLNLMALFKINFSKHLPLVSMLLTYTFVSFSWVYFAKSDLNEANLIIKSLFYNENFINLSQIVTLFALFLLFVIYPFFKDLKEILVQFLKATPLLLKPLLLSIIFTFIFAVCKDGIPDFIYASF
ncbi:MBOAT family O-acyltransferase [Campylobacter gastrosuis]|uniref:MBOAT family protein n=1 Tax=Campylobacter gastrosuis TaxID=2974576 RepID=A0ABT7HS04_9BACT|nr:MBOAT family O-acyltransferase [Campylobacter gastrosuis]MDL0089198.1 MBOAT family protein [Campylobacter gastrosuis]